MRGSPWSKQCRNRGSQERIRYWSTNHLSCTDNCAWPWLSFHPPFGIPKEDRLQLPEECKRCRVWKMSSWQTWTPRHPRRSVIRVHRQGSRRRLGLCIPPNLQHLVVGERRVDFCTTWWWMVWMNEPNLWGCESTGECENTILKMVDGWPAFALNIQKDSEYVSELGGGWREEWGPAGCVSSAKIWIFRNIL